MISSTRSNLAWIATVSVGVILCTVSMSSLLPEGKLRHDGNHMALYGSAYGRLLARLSETTVDRVWHLGVEQIVPHNIDGSAAQGGGSVPIDLEEGSPKAPAKPGLEHMKDWFYGMRVAKYTRTNPYSLNETHLANVKKDVEKLLLKSYKMDPGHYGTYNSYHLFLTTHDFGGNELSRKHAVNVANMTLGAIYHEKEDPEPWLTAASAAMNLYLLETAELSQAGKDIPLDTLKEYRSKIGFCLNRFQDLQTQAEDNGNWDNLSTERQIEIIQRYRFASRTFKQFDAMIARAENPDAPAPAEASVVEKTEEEE